MTINHALHGYNNGHNLIASSTELSSESKKDLLIMSDMSGPSMQIGFEEYITGYPLRDINLYAFAKTWYAPEMKRPGCVWTHTLLINFSDLIKLNYYSDLINLFKRPIDSNNFDYYKRPLKLNSSLNYEAFNKTAVGNSELAKEVLYSLYKKPNSSILIQAKTPSSFENLVLSIWTQQWPRLRRNFSFCTGAITIRQLNNRRLDLQIVPEKIDSNLKNSQELCIFDSKAIYEDNKIDDWLIRAYNDLLTPSKIRDFLNIYGADVTADRSLFISLVEVFIYLCENEKDKNISKIIKILREKFPLSSEANSLKIEILGKPSIANEDSKFHFYNEEDVLVELAVTKYSNSFDFSKLNLIERIETLYKLNSTQVFQLLDRLILLEINPYGEKIFKEIVNIISQNDLKELSQNYRKLLLIFLNYKPQLAYYKEIWNVNLEDQREIFSILLKSHLKENLEWQKILDNVVDIDENVIDEIIKRNLIDYVNYILNRCNLLNNNIRLNYTWIKFLSNKSKEILHWLSTCEYLQSYTLELILANLDPNSKEIINNGSDLWLRFIARNSITLENRLNILFKSFILALAFNLPDNNSLQLINYSFETVYKAAMDDRLDYNSWRYIEIHTKPLSFWNEWDKCKKLRNALIDRFIEEDWPINSFSSIFKDKNTIQHLLLYYKKSDRNRKFIKELQKKLDYYM